MCAAQYDDQYDGSNRICPYCGYKYKVEAEEVSETTRVEDCENCGKKFYAQEVIDITHKSTPDCELNGQAHQWAPWNTEYGPHDFCSVCAKCRPF